MQRPRITWLTTLLAVFIALLATTQPAQMQPAAANYLYGNRKDAPGFVVWVVSPRAGLTFTDSDPVDVRVRVQQAPGPVRIDFVVADAGGPWRQSGTLALARGTSEAALPLALPGRSLYGLSITASSGTATSKAETSIAIVFPPAPADRNSRWGVFAAPQDFITISGTQPVEAAHSKRLLGASWARFNYPAPVYDDARTVVTGSGPQADVTADVTPMIGYVKALHDEGISVMGDLIHVPRILSSRPEDNAIVVDSAPGFATVPPKDYALWDKFVQSVVTQYRGLIQVWHVGNEPDLAGRYWRGTPEQFVEMVQRTAAAVKKADPSALIASPGMTTRATGYAERLLELGLGKSIDIFTVHYTEEQPEMIDAWRKLLDKRGLRVPIWNSEERSAIPLNNIIGGQGPFIKFLHVDIDGYREYNNLVRQDLTVLPPGIAYSVAAHQLGEARWVRASGKLEPGWAADLFKRGDEEIAVIRRLPPPAKLFDPKWEHVTAAQLRADPLTAERPITATDTWGHSRNLSVANGRARLALDENFLFVNGARLLEIEESEVVKAPNAIVVEAESGSYSKGWNANGKAGYSENKVLEIWTDVEDPGGYWVELPFSVRNRGDFEVIFAGSSLEHLSGGRGNVSTFAWSIDGGEERRVDNALPATRNIAGAPEGVSTLGTVTLASGRHTFRLRLLTKNDPPVNRYAIWFDALAVVAK